MYLEKVHFLEYLYGLICWYNGFVIFKDIICVVLYISWCYGMLNMYIFRAPCYARKTELWYMCAIMYVLKCWFDGLSMIYMFVLVSTSN
jgi:hypothetical protein